MECFWLQKDVSEGWLMVEQRPLARWMTKAHCFPRSLWMLDLSDPSCSLKVTQSFLPDHCDRSYVIEFQIKPLKVTAIHIDGVEQINVFQVTRLAYIFAGLYKFIFERSYFVLISQPPEVHVPKLSTLFSWVGVPYAVNIWWTSPPWVNILDNGALIQFIITWIVF